MGILEKRRLEELMIIAKKRESSVPKDSPVVNKERSPTPLGRERTPSVGRESTPSRRESTPSRREGTPSSNLRKEREKSIARKEEEEKIREENRIRDEEIRKMQQKKLEGKKK